MKLHNLFEQSECSEIWYHGSSDVREINASGFSEQYKSVRVLQDIEKYNQLKEQLVAIKESGSTEYMDILGEMSKLISMEYKPRPTYFTNKRSVAKTYADPRRAFDYQGSEPKIVKVCINVSNTMTFQAKGKTFHDFKVNELRNELTRNGVNESETNTAIEKLLFHQSSHSRLRPSDISYVAQELGFDSVKFKSIIDTYDGKGEVSDTMAVFDVTNDVKILDNF